LLERRPAQLSGGQRQRVAMGRAIVRQPQAFLMDEPLSNLDAKLRVHMRAEVSRLHRDLETTTIYVTHDQVEAMTMGDRVAVIRKGELQQVGSPQELFAEPVNLFVAGFIGSPSMNFVKSTVESSDGSLKVQVGAQEILVSNKALSERPALKDYAGKEVIVGVRPQDFEDAALVPDAGQGSSLRVRVDLVEALGTETLLHFEVDAPTVLTEDMKELAADVSADAVERLEAKAEQGRNEFVAQIDPRTRIKRGDETALAVDTTQLHFFDPDTNLGIYGDKRPG
jgi:multiple sugar transport system ATP-binding protein